MCKLSQFIALILSFILLSSCDKEGCSNCPTGNSDTIKPLSYFPAYPGSYWKYRLIQNQYDPNSPNYDLVKSDTSYKEITTSPDYQLHGYLTRENYDYSISPYQPVSNPDSQYVPFYDNIPIYGYHKIDYLDKPPFGPISFARYPFLSEEIGFTFKNGWYDGRFGYLGPYYEILSKDVNPTGDSIITVFGDYKLGPIEMIGGEEWKWYQKDVGLISHYIFSNLIGDTIKKMDLIDYFINN